MNTPTTIKQALQTLSENLKGIIIPKGGEGLVTTETTPPATPTQPAQPTPK